MITFSSQVNRQNRNLKCIDKYDMHFFLGRYGEEKERWLTE